MTSKHEQHLVVAGLHASATSKLRAVNSAVNEAIVASEEAINQTHHMVEEGDSDKVGQEAATDARMSVETGNYDDAADFHDHAAEQHLEAAAIEEQREKERTGSQSEKDVGTHSHSGATGGHSQSEKDRSADIGRQQAESDTDSGIRQSRK